MQFPSNTSTAAEFNLASAKRMKQRQHAIVDGDEGVSVTDQKELPIASCWTILDSRELAVMMFPYSRLSDANATDLVYYGRIGDVIDRDTYVVVHTPSEPTSYLGNQIIGRGDMTPDNVSEWVAVFSREFADVAGVEHITINAEGHIHPRCGQLTSPPLQHVENLVLSISTPFPSFSDRPDVAVGRVTDERTWEAIVEGQLVEQGLASPEARAYFTRHFAVQRDLAQDGQAIWLAATVDSAIASTLGLLRRGDLVRFQAIRTDPQFRRRGIASHLMTAALKVADEDFGTTRAVLVTNDDHPEALSVYKHLGFVYNGRQSFLHNW